jgi:hypothetical protein
VIKFAMMAALSETKVYDGNQLPEELRDGWELAVCVVYALYVCVILSLAGYSMLSRSWVVEREAPPHMFMEQLMMKHNAAVYGALAFVPATYILVHLYTSSLHNGQLYTASNVALGALLGLGASYMGTALAGLLEDAKHMDAIKAVYETLYLCAFCAKRLQPREGVCSEKEVLNAKQLVGVTSSRYVQYDVFLLTAAEDDRRLWSGFWESLLMAMQWRRPETASKLPKAAWLFSKESLVRTFTGSMIILHDLPQILTIASFQAQRLYLQAQVYINAVAKKFSSDLTKLQEIANAAQAPNLSIGYSEGTIKLKELSAALCKIGYGCHGLYMMCERYACRRTPVLALGDNMPVLALRHCMEELYGRGRMPVACDLEVNRDHNQGAAGLSGPAS